MKKLLTILMITFCISSYGQNVKMDANGNYVAIKSENARSSSAISTGKTYTDSKGRKYDVYKSERGKLFIFVVSKSGNTYKKYLSI